MECYIGCYCIDNRDKSDVMLWAYDTQFGSLVRVLLCMVYGILYVILRYRIKMHRTLEHSGPLFIKSIDCKLTVGVDRAM